MPAEDPSEILPESSSGIPTVNSYFVDSYKISSKMSSIIPAKIPVQFQSGTSPVISSRVLSHSSPVVHPERFRDVSMSFIMIIF